MLASLFLIGASLTTPQMSVQAVSQTIVVDSDDAMARAVRTFTGVPHRLEVVGSVDGATWVNDSIATSPERTIAGLRAFSEPVA